MTRPLELLGSFLASPPGETDVLFQGRTMASVRRDSLQVTIDTEVGEIGIVHWSGLDRTEVLRVRLDDPSAKARIESTIQTWTPPLPPAIEV